MLVALARRTRLFVRALPVAAGALACAATPAASAAAACTPPGAQRSADVARAVHPDGSMEATEVMANGEYRVTRCGKDGRLVVSQTVSPILDPDGGTVLVPTERREPGVTVALLYGDPADPGWAAEFRAARAEIAAQVLPPTAAPPASPPVSPGPPAALPLTPQPARAQVAAAVAGDACTNPQYSFWWTAWGTRTYGYRVNRSRFGYNDTTVASIVDGHRNWDETFNSCGLNDITNLTSQHLGSTSATIHTYLDGVSITDKGSLASMCPGALACTWLFSDASGLSAESDQRFNENIAFSNIGAAGAYDYESISTHETGHTIGLDHANSSNALTMYFQIATGTTYSRSLAKGDVLGLRARYP